MSVITPSTASVQKNGNVPTGGGHPKRWLLGMLAAVAAAGLAVGLLVATSGTGPTKTTTPTTAPSTTAPPGSSTTAPPATTVPPAVPSELATAVYPTPGSGTRFVHPVAAARAFAVDFVGFVDPVIGRFVATGAESGTVAVRASPSGAVTSVQLHRITGSWWVLGSSTPDIRLDVPAASATIASPVRLQGTSTAFEAQVNAEVRQDGARMPIGTGRVMGGSTGAMAPFDGSVAFNPPTAARGALVLFTVSMQTGNVYEATVVRVAFAPSLSLVPTSACPDYAMARPTAPTGEMVVTVFYSCSVDASPVPTYRLFPATTAVLRTALDELLAGPSAAERAAGLTSWFSSTWAPSTAGYLRSVTVSSGNATVDFGDLPSVIPNASTSTGSHLLLSQLDATVFQFPSITSVIYRIDGSCQAFGEWLQLDGCVLRTRSAST
ncbi:MAG: GerMN domain-containing protein [Actinomycetota bacterium]|nr:GerMN domain-containing protein [Actinomycetota bacterium]MDA8358948.1 GerMN domain-containing protein [Actinomycetota bacterium]